MKNLETPGKTGRVGRSSRTSIEHKVESGYFTLRYFLFKLLVSLNHFSSRIKHSCIRMYGELVCKEFSRSLSTNGDY